MTQPNARHVNLLRRTLTANAIFSSLCAVVFVVASGAVADLVGAPRADILSTGISLVLFVAMILTVLTRRDLRKRWVLGLTVLIASLDVLWVLTTPIKIASFTAAGQAIFAVIALVVALFAALQIRALYGIFVGRRREGTSARTVGNLS